MSDFLKAYFDLETLKREAPEFAREVESMIDSLRVLIGDGASSDLIRGLLSELDWEEFHDFYLDVVNGEGDDLYRAEVIAEYDRRVRGD